MNLTKTCFLDMDGVLADFVGGVCKAHDRKTPYEDPKSFGIFDMEKLWGIDAEAFWGPLEYEGFWYWLDKTPEADEIVELVCGQFGSRNIAILTSPSEYAHCIPEKKEWMKKHYPELAKQMFFGSAKRFMGGPGKVLVDDRDFNIKEFENAVGQGITVCRPWNWLHGYDPILHLKDCLHELKD